MAQRKALDQDDLGQLAGTFARLLASVGLAGAVPYDLRPSFASLLLHEGRSVHYVARGSSVTVPG